MLYAFLAWCARHALRWCWRDVHVVGSVPAHGPVLLAVNHPNDLADICAVLAHVPRRVTFVANVSAAESRIVAWAYDRMGVVPVHRVRDARKAKARGMDSAAANAQAFERVRRVLAAGGCVCVFPEGGVHRGPHLGALRTGLARMALDAHASGAAPELAIVPLGITYEAPAELRSRVLLEVGDPIRLDDWRPDEGRPADTQLTARIAMRLRRVTRNAPDEAAAYSLRAVADLAAAASAQRGDPEPPLLAGSRVWAAVADDIYGPGIATEAAADPRLDAARALVARIDGVAGGASRTALLTAWAAGNATTARLGVLAVMGVPGALLHAPAWSAAHRLAQRGAAAPEELVPRCIVPGLYVLTAWYALLGVAAVAWVGAMLSERTGLSPLWALPVAPLLPLLLAPLGDSGWRWLDARRDRRLARQLRAAMHPDAKSDATSDAECDANLEAELSRALAPLDASRLISSHDPDQHRQRLRLLRGHGNLP